MMRRIVFAVLFAVVFIFSAMPALNVSAATGDGFYIENYHADVTAGSDRRYDVTETIDVIFEEPGNGFYRRIPAWSWLEKFTIEGFQAAGEPYVMEGEDCLRIGDAETRFTGQKTFIIEYTLIYYADEVPDADYFFINLIDTEWGVRIENFSADITLPESATPEEYTLTGGAYGKEVPGLADVKVAGNIIHIEGLQALKEWDGLAFNVKLPEGTFYAAAARVPPLEVEQLDITVDIDAYGVMSIEESYKAKVNSALIFDRRISGYTGKRSGSIPTYRLSGNGESPVLINDFTVTPNEAADIKITDPAGRVTYGEDALNLQDYTGQTVSFSINYTLENRLRETMSEVGFYLQLMKGYYTEMRVERLDISVTAPFEILRLYGGGGGSLRQILDEPVISGNRLTAQSIEPFENQDISYVVEFSNAGFIRRPNIIDIALPVILLAAMFLVLFFALLHKKEKPVVPVVGFYPPEGMNPAEVGYVIDERVTGRDVTSLIYYWASHGHLKIEIIDDKNYVLHHLTDLDEGHTDYENNMFSSLWMFGAKRRSVTGKELKDKIYSVVKATAGYVKKSFSGERGLYVKGRSPIVTSSLFIMSIGFTAFAIMGQFVDYVAGVFPLRPLFGADKRFGEYENDFYIMFIFVLFSLLITMYLATNFYRSDRALKSTAGIIRRIVCLVLTVAGAVMFTFVCGDGKVLLTLPAAVSISSLYIIVNSLPFIARLSDFGVHARGLCLGFKMFLVAAEKQRLEMLLKENPDYFYNILSYVQVLGVSKIWQGKFDRLTINPSSWLYGNGIDYAMANRVNAMNNMTNNIGRRSGRSAGRRR